jgi:hypothetical protein
VSSEELFGKASERSIKSWEKQEALRNAEVAYITDRQRRPAEYWWDTLCSDITTLAKFIIRARRGQWAVRREEYWEEVTQEVLRKSKYRAIRDQVKELQEIQQLRDDALEVVQPRIVGGRKIYPVAPKSMESMINAIVKIEQWMDHKRDGVLSMIEPELRQQVGDQSTSPFAPDEMRQVARLLLERKRLKQRGIEGNVTEIIDKEESVEEKEYQKEGCQKENSEENNSGKTG